MADREGVPVRDVLVADASRRTTTLNAYVSGFGGTRRIVLYDTLVDDLPREQAVSVVAHELAHAKHRDVVVGSALGAVGALAGVGLLGLVVGAGPLRRRYGAGLAAGAVMVPLLIALVDVGSLLASPVQNGISRRIETRADVDALKATGDPVAFEAMQLMLAPALAQRPDAAGAVAVVVREPSDDAASGSALARRARDGVSRWCEREAWIVSQVSWNRVPTPPPKA